jgi:hypothetical protein
MDTSWESVGKHVTGSYFLFKKFSMPQSFLAYHCLSPLCLSLLSQKHLNSYPNIPLSNLPLLLSLITFTPTDTHETSHMVPS